MNLWNVNLDAVEGHALAKQFARTLADRLEANMRRLRLGGNDPIMVYRKSWREAVRIQRARCAEEGVLLDSCLFGLALVKEHHCYGGHIHHQLIRGPIVRGPDGGLLIPMSLDI